MQALTNEREGFRVGDLVVYDGEICRVTEIGVPPVASDGKIYYFLKPLFYDGIIYTPVDTRVSMRPVIDRDEAIRLMREIPCMRVPACLTRDKKAVREYYQQLMSPRTCRAYAETIASICEKRRGAGSKTGSGEDQLAKSATQRLCDELSVALGVSDSEAKDMVEQAFASRVTI